MTLSDQLACQEAEKLQDPIADLGWTLLELFRRRPGSVDPESAVEKFDKIRELSMVFLKKIMKDKHVKAAGQVGSFYGSEEVSGWRRLWKV